MPSTRVLFVSYYLEDARSLLRLANMLRDEYAVEPVFLITSRPPLREPALAAVAEAGYELLDPPEWEQFDAGGSAYNPFRRAKLLREANVAIAQRLLDEAQPDAILCTLDTAGNWFLQTAKDRGIPSLLLQWTEVHSLELHHCWWDLESRSSDARFSPLVRLRRRFRRKLDRLAGIGPHWPFAAPASALAVPGSFYRDMAISGGVPPERLFVTGNLQSDDMYRFARLENAELAAVRSSLHLPPDLPFLLFAHDDTTRLGALDAQSARDSEAVTLRAMREAAAHLPRVIKLHPKDTPEVEARLRALDPEACIAAPNVPIAPLIAASAMVFSVISSALLWAVGIDRPAISSFLWRGVDCLKLERHHSGVEHADSYEALVTAIRRNLQDPSYAALWTERRRRCREEFLLCDGEGARRIVSLFSSLLGKQELSASPLDTLALS